MVYNPVTGYAYDIVYVEGAPSSILAAGITGGLHDVVVEFLPEIAGAAIINPAGDNIIVP